VERRASDDAGVSLGAPAAPAEARHQSAAKEYNAGTGMGEAGYHPTTEVAFNYDEGMYDPDQALVVLYDFAPAPAQPNPFPGLSYAPVMPR
jgi:hypothetical protein